MSDYDTDLLLWSERQAALLRRAAAGERVNDQVDWENVAEEIESLGRSDRRELTQSGRHYPGAPDQAATSPTEGPRTGWRETILEQRRRVARLLKESPSLRPDLPQVIWKSWKTRRRRRRLPCRATTSTCTSIRIRSITPLTRCWVPGCRER